MPELCSKSDVLLRPANYAAKLCQPNSPKPRTRGYVTTNFERLFEYTCIRRATIPSMATLHMIMAFFVVDAGSMQSKSLSSIKKYIMCKN